MSTPAYATPETMSEPPWYRQFWPWVLIALPLTAVVAGIATVFIAMHDPDGLVVDDYYKAGLAINRSIERDRLAAERGVRGRLLLSDGTLRVDLATRDGPLAEPIRVTLAHATRAGKDRSFELEAQAAGTYGAEDVAALPPGRWNVRVETADWRIVGGMRVPGSGVTELSALR